MSLIEQIHLLKKNHNLSKHEQLVQGVVASIENESLKVGDKLPSINTMVDEIGYARKTIVKAYEELKHRGLIESKRLKEFYIISEETNTTLKVALLLFAFESFQKDFYNTFRNELGNRFQINVFFHHNNSTIFETILSNIHGKYGMYVVAPIQNSSVLPLLRRLPPQKLLLVDRYLNLGPEYSFICQEFEKSTYTMLIKLLKSIKKYERFILFFDEKDDYSPKGIAKAFQKFLVDYKIKGAILNEYVPKQIERDTLYFIKNDSTLWSFLKDCAEKDFILGRDVGLLSFDDNIAKQIVFGGITTLSTDFKAMAKMAADHVKDGPTQQTIIPVRLIKRNSL